MRRTIGASESSSIYLLGICVGSLLSLFLSLALRNVSATLDGMSVYSWCGYAIMQVGFIATVFVYTRVRKVDVVRVAKSKANSIPFKSQFCRLSQSQPYSYFCRLQTHGVRFWASSDITERECPCRLFQM